MFLGFLVRRCIGVVPAFEAGRAKYARRSSATGKHVLVHQLVTWLGIVSRPCACPKISTQTRCRTRRTPLASAVLDKWEGQRYLLHCRRHSSRLEATHIIGVHVDAVQVLLARHVEPVMDRHF
jgi:hypothetical protein